MSQQSLEFKCLATAIGSLPYTESEPACNLVLKYLSSIPASPELPKLGYKHTFCGPLLENLPGLISDDKKETFYFNTSDDFSDDMALFYENYFADNVDFFKISNKRVKGFYHLLELLKKTTSIKPEYFKCQLPGPITAGLTLKDEKGKSIIYNEEFMSMLTKAIIMKARWQIKEIMKVCPQIIFFFDEPGLVSYGSSYFNIEKDFIINCLNEVFTSVNVITGSHCCGNTDWSLFMDTNVNIINFDAYKYSGAMALYPEKLNDFLNRDGALAWGIIPNSEEINKFSEEKIINKFEKEIDILVEKGFEKKKLLNSSLITPSCGLGNSTIEIAEKVLSTAKNVSLSLREKYFDFKK